MSKHDLAARPIYHHKRESIDAHLTIVFAALAVGRLVEDRTGWSIRKFVRTTRRYRTVHIRAPKWCAAWPGSIRTAMIHVRGVPAPPPRPRVAAAQHPLNGTLPSP